MEHTKKRMLLGALCTICSAILFGLMPFLAKTVYQHGGTTYSAAFGRSFFAALTLLLLSRILPDFSLRVTRKQLTQILLLSVFFTLTQLTLYACYNYIGSGLATTLHFTYPIFVMLILAVFFHARIQSKQLFCLMLCIIGMLLLYAPDGSSSAFGMIIAISSGLVYSLYVVYLGRSNLNTVPVLTLTFWVSLFSAAGIALFAAPQGLLPLPTDAQGWGAIFILAFFSSVCALALFQKGLFLCGAVKASLLSTFEPLTGVAVGLLFLHEACSLRSAIGILAILLSTAVLVIPSRKKAK